MEVIHKDKENTPTNLYSFRNLPGGQALVGAYLSTSSYLFRSDPGSRETGRFCAILQLALERTL